MSTIVRRRQWAYALISRTPKPAPAYGSVAWLALPDSDPAKLSGLVVAAESWARDGDELEERLRAEVASMRREHKLRDDEGYADAQEAHRARWVPVAERSARVLPFAERRRRQLEGARPRPEDFQGFGGDAS